MNLRKGAPDAEDPSIERHYNGHIKSPRLFTNHTEHHSGGGYGEPAPGTYNIMARGTHNAEIINITNALTDYMPSDISGLQMRQSALDVYDNSLTGSNLSVIGTTPWKPLTGHALEQNWWVQVNAQTNSNIYLGTRNLAFAIDAADQPDSTTDQSSDPDVFYEEESGGTFFTEHSGVLWSADDDAEILTTTDGFATFSTPTEGTTGPLIEGIYYYKFAFEYDDKFESPLSIDNVPKTFTPSTPGNTLDYIQLTISLPSSVLESLNPRITGISVYRKFGGGDEDEYSLLEVVKFDGSWIYNAESDSYLINVFDKGNLLATYFAMNGVDQTVQNTSLNYGLSASIKGYLFVSRAWHPDIEDDVKHYIFRSQPDNFYTFDWKQDFVIMPETPIAMTEFNSKLYVWGEKKLYKVDPFNMVIEDEFEGVSIAHKDSFVKTEFGLCFLDKNNIYLHDGNKPNPIGDDILYATNPEIIWYDVDSDNTGGAGFSSSDDGHIQLDQGYRDLIQHTLDNDHRPYVFYSGLKNSFVILLSNEGKVGKAFAFNIKKSRWDFWDAPVPNAATLGKDSDILIHDETNIWNYMKDTSKEWHMYRRRRWDWVSSNINLGSDTQEKVFRTLSLSGTPTVATFRDPYNNATYPGLIMGLSEYENTIYSIPSVQAFIDNKKVDLTVNDKFYETTELGNTYLAGTMASLTGTTAIIKRDIYRLINPTDVGDGTTGSATESAIQKQEFIRPGHLIKIDDEIMLVRGLGETINHEYPSLFQQKLWVLRGVMGTEAAVHSLSYDTSIYIVSPKLKFPNGSKGKNLKIKLLNQYGHVDGIGITYKDKKVK